MFSGSINLISPGEPPISAESIIISRVGSNRFISPVIFSGAAPPMAKQETTILTVAPRAIGGSRATRRLRRAGRVPGILYGGEGDPVPFAVDARELRTAVQATGAVIELTMDGRSTPAVLKETQRHPVRGETTHVDFLRVNLSKPIQAVVPLGIVGAEESPGAKEGGIVDHQLREVNVEALPTDIPESIELDVSELVIGDTVLLSAASPPADVTILDDPDAVVVTVLAPRLQEEGAEGEAIEEETELVGEEAAEEAGESGESGGEGE